MTKGVKILIILGIGILALGLLVYFVFFYKTETTPKIPQEKVKELVPTPEVIEKSQEKTPQEKEEIKTEVNLESLAKSFTERFGSFSNQSNYENITELKLVMSDSMIVWADNFVEDQKQKTADSDEYYGITTKAISVKNTNLSDYNAVYMVSAQRVESFSDGKTNVFYQDIEITLVLENGEWKVDSAVWK